MNSTGGSNLFPICETCGEVIDFQAATENHILRAIAIATEIHLSESQSRRYLKRLEASGRVQRIGERGGWQRAA